MIGVPTETVSRPFAQALVDAGARDPRIVCVSNDLTTSCEMDEFRSTFPDRFLSLGMAEQNIGGVLSGLAREGLVPVYASFAVFATRRPYEQIALNVAYPALPVRIFGFLPGLSTPGGVTHQAIDDIGLMRQLPNMTVIEVADAMEIATLWPALEDVAGPVYCRMLRGEVRRRFREPFTLGHARTLAHGRDALLITSGLMTELGTAIVDHARSRGVSIGHIHVSTLKPFPTDEICEAISSTNTGVVTAENHLRVGGLGSIVAELIADRGLGRPLTRVGIDDTFACGGSTGYLFSRFGLDEAAIAAAIDRLIPHAGLRDTMTARRRREHADPAGSEAEAL